MDLRSLMRHATEPEREVILNVLRRVVASPAVVVTVREGGRRRRYVVALEDEQELRRFVGHSAQQLQDELGGRAALLTFGAQWLRGPGRVDEMYRSLSMAEVVRVAVVDRSVVWGHPVAREG
jgi:hypothetical protein